MDEQASDQIFQPTAKCISLHVHQFTVNAEPYFPQVTGMSLSEYNEHDA